MIFNHGEIVPYVIVKHGSIREGIDRVINTVGGPVDAFSARTSGGS